MDNLPQYFYRRSDSAFAFASDMAPSHLKESKNRSHRDISYRQHVSLLRHHIGLQIIACILTKPQTAYSGLIASIVRFVIFFHSDAFEDGTWASADLTIWTSLEPGVYLMAACFPTYRPLVSLVFQSILSSSFLSRSLKQHTRDVHLRGVGPSSSGTIGEGRTGALFTHAKDKIFVDDGDQKGLVNCYPDEERSAEVRSE